MADYVFQLLSVVNTEDFYLDLKEADSDIYLISFINKYFVLVESYVELDLEEIRNKLKEYSFNVYKRV